MNHLAIVGCEASGKTVFMSALADYYRASLTPENPAANRFARLAARQLRAQRQWPAATNPERSIELDFALRANGRRLARFSMLEFGGETFRAAFRDEEEAPAHARAVRQLLDYLEDADFIAVLVSIKELLRDPGIVSMEDFERDTESLWVTRGLLEFIRAKLPHADVVIGLTRADLYRKELADAGGAAALFARHWPSIRAVAPDIPVVPVASVSATDADGRPADGFSTAGALTIMQEYVRQSNESPERLLGELNAAKAELEALSPSASPTFYANKLKRFVTKLDKAESAAIVSGSAHAEEIAALRQAAAAFTQTMKQSGPKPKAKSRKKKDTKGSPIRTLLLLLLLLAAGGGALCYLYPHETQHFADAYLRPLLNARETLEKQKRERTSTPPRIVCITNLITEVRVVTNLAAQTRVSNGIEMAPKPATKPSPADSAEAAKSVMTNVAPVSVATPATAKSETQAYRIWHDHRGTPIEARWTETSEDGKTITLVTRGGRQIRAVLRKFSPEDRAYVEQTLR